jgi:cytoskeletal protein RodZ
MKALKKLLGILVLFVVGVVVAMMKKILAFGVVATAVGLINLALGKDTTAAGKRPHSAKPAHQVATTKTGQNVAAKVAGPNAPVPSSGPALTPSAPLGARAISAARNAAAAQNAQLSKETGQAVPTPRGAQPPAPAPQNQAPAGAPAVQQGAPTPSAGTAAPNAVAARRDSASTAVMRETFDYTRDTRRDPFVSLMTTSDLRPTLSDLRLTGILYDLSGRRPVAILRDFAGGQWRVTTGMTLGRMRVAQIKPKIIIFTIEEFGFNRQDSLILGDTTRARRR